MKKINPVKVLGRAFRKINRFEFITSVVLIIGFAALLWIWRIDSSLASFNFELARLYAMAGNPRLSVELAKRASVSKAELPLLRHMIAEQYIKLKNFSEAEKILGEALVMNPGDAEALFLIALSRYRQHDLVVAEEKLKQAISLSPINADNAFDLLGSIYLDRGENSLAEETFKKGLLVNPYNANLHNGLGVAYFRQGKASMAKEEYRRALEIEPSHFNAMNNLRSMMAE